ncbi:hypothetical protein D3C71_424260 [compost metagenome]
MYDRKSWRELIGFEMAAHDEGWKDIVSITLTDRDLNRKFDSGYGGEEGKPFTAWTKNRVYFPICYDGSEWCGSVSRNPDGQPTHHQGG